MDSRLLLLEQIKLALSKADISYNTDNREEIVINNFPCIGITIEISERLDIYFKSFDKIDFNALATYFKPRLKYENVRVFYNSMQLNIYLDKKFSSDKKGNFERAMWTLQVIEYFNNNIKKLIEELL